MSNITVITLDFQALRNECILIDLAINHHVKLAEKDPIPNALMAIGYAIRLIAIYTLIRKIILVLLTSRLRLNPINH